MENQTSKFASLKMINKILEELIILERMRPKDSNWKTKVRPIKFP